MKTWEEILSNEKIIESVLNDIKDARSKGALWSEITDEVIIRHAIFSFILLLKQAEKDGLVCINPTMKNEK